MIPQDTYAEIEKAIQSPVIRIVVRAFIRRAFREAWEEIVEKSDGEKVSLRDVRDVLKIIL